jgi:hypothetical protein
MSFKVTGILKGEPESSVRCGRRYTIEGGFESWSAAEKFATDYMRKQGRRFWHLRVEKEGLR